MPRASPAESVNWAPECANATAVVPISAAAPTITMTMPIQRSAFSYFMNRGVIRLSITYDCWKKSCHGAIVVPTMPITSSMTAAMPPVPTLALAALAGRSGVVNPVAMAETDGCAIRYSGTSSSEPTQKNIATRSNARNEPVNAVAMMIPAANSTAMILGTPR
jgi:hypothetical protein